MAQVAIREYDAKRMFAEFSSTSYNGILLQDPDDLQKLDTSFFGGSGVIKPDQLFGKRGKYGLIGVNISLAQIRNWFSDHFQKEYTIGQQTGKLHTFLVEPFVPHSHEYYVALKTERSHDVLYFSREGGIEVEENWDKVQSLDLDLGDPILSGQKIRERFADEDPRVVDFLVLLYRFFVEYGFAYLEVNPFTFDNRREVVCLDMVARVDDSEIFRQKNHWKDLDFPHPFGPEKTEGEKYIEKLDSETGASLKFRLLNPSGRIWLLTSGGGASVIIADTLADMGYTHEIGNYGECSGNPDRENTRAYTLTLLEALLRDESHHKKYLIIAGAIANFTHIDKTFSGIIDAFTEQQDRLRAQGVHILVRRGGINDRKGLIMMKEVCAELNIPCEIADGSMYMTDILSSIKI